MRCIFHKWDAFSKNDHLSENITDQQSEESKEKNSKKILNKTKTKQKESKDNFKEKLDKLREEKLRVLAEMENLRKRVEREKVESIKFGSINLARDILSTNDNLSRALENIPNEKERSEPINNLIDGLKMVQKELLSILERHGVKKIDAIDNKFDHNFHQAMFEVETSDKAEGTVVQEVQTGYTMYQRLLRPSMVGVSKKPQKEKKSN